MSAELDLTAHSEVHSKIEAIVALDTQAYSTGELSRITLSKHAALGKQPKGYGSS